jgi:hypothetical protein
MSLSPLYCLRKLRNAVLLPSGGNRLLDIGPLELFDLGSLLCYKIRRGTKMENTLYYGDNKEISKKEKK